MTEKMVTITQDEMETLARIIYDDISVTAANFLDGVTGFEREVALETLHRARDAIKFLAKCGDNDQGLVEECDALANALKVE